MGVKIGDDSAKSGKNTHLVVIMRMRLSQKIGLQNLTNQTRFKKVNGTKQRTKSISDYFRICLMLHACILLLQAHKFRPPGDVLKELFLSSKTVDHIKLYRVS